MRTAQYTREDVFQAVREVARATGALKAVVFGSFARQSQTKRSDLDLMFIEDTTEDFLDRIGRYLELLRQKPPLKFFDIDVFVYTPEELEQMLREGNKFLQRILREGILLYES